MMTLDLIARMQSIRETLAEARRYVRSDPALVRTELARARVVLTEIIAADLTETFGGDTTGRRYENFCDNIERLLGNLCVAGGLQLVDPEVAQGYMDGARLELQWAAKKIAKEVTHVG